MIASDVEWGVDAKDITATMRPYVFEPFGSILSIWIQHAVVRNRVSTGRLSRNLLAYRSKTRKNDRLSARREPSRERWFSLGFENRSGWNSKPLAFDDLTRYSGGRRANALVSISRIRDCIIVTIRFVVYPFGFFIYFHEWDGHVRSAESRTAVTIYEYIRIETGTYIIIIVVTIISRGGRFGPVRQTIAYGLRCNGRSCEREFA